MKSEILRVAMGQITCVDGDRNGNFIRIEAAVQSAIQQKADVILFPESCILGWVNPEAHSLATPIPGPDSDYLCHLARSYQIHIAIGLDERAGNQLYDSALLIADNGDILYKHRKMNVLSELMSPPYSIGSHVGIVETRFGRIGIIICADSFEEPILDEMRAQHPGLMLIPYGWAADKSEWPQHGDELRKVVEHTGDRIGCPVVGTNLVGEISHGPWKGKTYGGLSVAYDKHRSNITIGADRISEVRTIEILVNRP